MQGQTIRRGDEEVVTWAALVVARHSRCSEATFSYAKKISEQGLRQRAAKAGGLAAAAQISLDQKARAVVEARAINLDVFKDALHVIARFRQRNALDPVHRINLFVARIAVLVDPLFGPARPGVVGNKRENVGAAPAGDVVAEFRAAKLGVV